MTIRATCASFLFALFLFSCGDSEAPPRSEACKQQDQAVQAAVDDTRHTPNAIVAVKNEACGVSLYASGHPADATTASLFLLASVTKTFVAATVLSLVKDGRLGLDDPINNWIAGLGAKYDSVTVRGGRAPECTVLATHAGR